MVVGPGLMLPLVLKAKSSSNHSPNKLEVLPERCCNATRIKRTPIKELGYH